MEHCTLIVLAPVEISSVSFEDHHHGHPRTYVTISMKKALSLTLF